METQFDFNAVLASIDDQINEQPTLEQRIANAISNVTKYGSRTIPPTPALAKANFVPTRTNRVPGFTARLRAMIETDFVAKHDSQPTNGYVNKAVLALRELSRDVYREMLNDKGLEVMRWGEFSMNEQIYYALMLEEMAMKANLRLFKCKHIWAAKGLLSDRCKVNKQTVFRRHRRAATQETNRDLGDLDDADRVE
ncbi:unnamed protein product [Rhizopus stolonifer]